jgi:RNA polymerase sigma-70 factor (ECF subfamily)
MSHLDALIAQARRGDRGAFEQLVREHHDAILAFCRGRLRNDQDADDALQDTFFSAYTGIRRFRGDASFSTWLHQIAASRCNDKLRALKRNKSQSLDELEETGMHVPAAGRSPEESALQRNLAAAALSPLTPAYQRILMLREVFELDYEEIAQVLHCTLDSVKARLRRARVELGKSYENPKKVPT